MTDLECLDSQRRSRAVPLRGRTITARPELVSDLDEVQRLLTLMGRPNPALNRFVRIPTTPRLGAATPTSSPRDPARFRVVRWHLEPSRIMP